jgi:hypothetical protein
MDGSVLYLSRGRKFGQSCRFVVIFKRDKHRRKQASLEGVAALKRRRWKTQHRLFRPVRTEYLRRLPDACNG